MPDRREIYEAHTGRLLERWEPDNPARAWRVFDGAGRLLERVPFDEADLEALRQEGLLALFEGAAVKFHAMLLAHGFTGEEAAEFMRRLRASLGGSS